VRKLDLPSCLLFFIVPSLCAQAAAPAKPAPRHWGPTPAVFPKGARMAVVSGDPGQAGQFTVELAMPANYKIPPHFHPTDENVTVKRGTLLVGMGDKWDAKAMKPMQAGASGSIPAKKHHFAEAQGPTIVSITAMGPFAMTYVNPADDPSKQTAKQ
jgi:quercetin dioxygenase-like cupin family protein